MSVTSELLEAGLRYLPRTIPLFGKSPEVAVGKGWPQWGATEQSVRAWFGEHGDRPDANVGIRTGGGLVGVDVDPRHGGDLALRRLEREHGPLPASPRVMTGGGGWHIYFRGARNLRSRDLRHDGYHGIEVKAHGCQLVAPPSIHPDTGREYVWHPAHPLIESEIAPLPGWLARRSGFERDRPDLAVPDLAVRDPLQRIAASVYVPRLTGREINHRGYIRCPFHADGHERTPSLRVYEQGGWKCFGCGIGGRIYQLGGLLAGYELPLDADARRVIRAELITEFAAELVA